MKIPVLKDIRFVNIGVDPMKPKAGAGWNGRRQWEACVKYKFLSAGQGLEYNKPLEHLQEGDIVAAFATGRGYGGVGIVEATAIKIKDFEFEGKKLAQLSIDPPYISGILNDSSIVPGLPYLRNTLFCNANNAKTEYVVKINWRKTVPLKSFFWKKNFGLFANPSIQSNLKNQQKTIEFLQDSFELKFT